MINFLRNIEIFINEYIYKFYFYTAVRLIIFKFLKMKRVAKKNSNHQKKPQTIVNNNNNKTNNINNNPQLNFNNTIRNENQTSLATHHSTINKQNNNNNTNNKFRTYTYPVIISPRKQQQINSTTRYLNNNDSMLTIDKNVEMNSSYNELNGNNTDDSSESHDDIDDDNESYENKEINGTVLTKTNNSNILHSQTEVIESTSANNQVEQTMIEEKSERKYESLTRDEVNQLTTYTRKSFFRRCKFVNSVLVQGHMNNFFEQIRVKDRNLQIAKTFHVIQCVKETLSSRRGYCTSQICNKMRGMSVL